MLSFHWRARIDRVQVPLPEVNYYYLITRKQLTRYERKKIISESIYKKVVDDEGEQIGGVADDDAGSGGTRWESNKLEG